jgi:hypothetical protein
MFSRTAAAAILLVSASSTYAADANRNPTLLGIYDSHHTLVGTYEGQNSGAENILTRQYGHTWYLIAYDTNGWINNAEFAYTSTDCSGQAYLLPNPDSQPTNAEFDSKILWATVDPTTKLSIQSFKFRGECNAATPHSYSVAPAVAIDTTSGGFSPPFTAR